MRALTTTLLALALLASPARAGERVQVSAPTLVNDVLAVGVTAPDRAESTTLFLGPGLCERVAAVFGAPREDVVAAVVDALGRALRRGRRSTRAAVRAVIDAVAGEPGVRFFRTAVGVQLAPRVAERLGRMAVSFFRETGQTLLVTSGTRDPVSQARAMYGKVRAGASILGTYGRRAAARDLNVAYHAARRTGTDAVAAMARVIQQQVQRGIYISRHLVAGAVDIRLRSMSARERRVFRHVVRSEPGVSAIAETRPPHWHVTFRHLPAESRAGGPARPRAAAPPTAAPRR